jgi:hypothetical protein
MNASVSICFVFLFSSIVLQAQVSNNNISSLIKLELHAPPYASHTQHNTVEWNCINKKLTEKCLVYHNDQWFSFIPNNDKIVYLNVGKQICKNKYGVQVLVLRGNPCEKLSYELIHCESFTNQSDTYIALRNLIANETYLINIDGFLGDLCSFEIAISDKPKGLPVASQIKKIDNLLTSHVKDSAITLYWQLPLIVKDSVSHFHVYCKKPNEKRFTLLSATSALGNARGSQQENYQQTDTLKDFGNYTYFVLGISEDEKHKWHLGELTYYNKEKIVSYMLAIENIFKRKDDLTLTLIDALNGKVLKHTYCERCIEDHFQINVKPWIEMGITRFKVLLTNNTTKLIKESRYRFNASTGKIEVELKY